MTLRQSIFTSDKYARIEWAFFIFIWFISPLLTDLEYGFNEEPKQLQWSYFQVNIIRRLVWGFFTVIPYYLYYKLAIQPLLIKKRYGYFLLSVLLFVAVRELYTVYIMYGSIARLSFLPIEMITEAQKVLKLKGRFHFGINYLVFQLLIMIALAYFIHLDKQEKQIRQLKQLQAETDLQYLRSQLQPHFFFNTLNNIYALALQQSQLTAPLVAKLSDMMRYVLYKTTQPKQPLTHEIHFLSNYVDVQSVRYHDKTAIRFDTQGITDQALIEPLLLLPYIENAFKHGIEEVHTGFIEVIICLNDQELTLSVKNSKAAGATDQSLPNSHGNGIGLDNTQKRLSILYPGRHSVQVKETNETYEVLLTIILN
ncbi:histidine kinase [Paraflavitalea soli]|uniref:Histidine kinase n=1 Tax=Paraflavitalea soli TaxID=2315862 RepID=A0A3B7MEV0_9BACT|nr:sensor histidine kinase [Paraflavitalea soli]AXY72864.1 histidine kinase [Paraflavitalea soli]